MKTVEELILLDEKDNLAVTSEEGQFLRAIVAVQNPKVVVEVGTGHGYSTCWMAMGMGKKGCIYTIDDTKLEHLFSENGQIRFLFGQLHNLMNEIPEKIDIAFLDSQHTIDNIVIDIERLSPRMKEGNVIIVHDTEYCDEMGRCLRDYFGGEDTERLKTVGVKPSREKWYYSDKKTKYGLGIAIKGKNND